MRALLLAAAAILTVMPASAAEFTRTETIESRVPLIVIEGEIQKGDAARFRAMADTIPRGRAIVVLRSPGGYALESLMIGEAVRSHGFETSVPQNARCMSGCGLIWLAGTKRYLHADGVVGFHGAFDPKTNRAGSATNAMIGGYLMQLGYSYTTIAFCTSAAPNQMAILSARTSAQAEITYTGYR
jgi:hypothetical protein